MKSSVFVFVFFTVLAVPLFALSDIGLVCDFSNSSTSTVRDFVSAVEDDDMAKATFVFSWIQMENLKKNDSLAQAIRNLVLSHRAEVLSGAYFDIDFAHAPDDIIYSQMKRFKLLAESVFGEKLSGFSPPDLKIKNSDVDIIKRMGFEYVVASEKAIPAEVSKDVFCQPVLMENGVILYPVNVQISAAASNVLVENWEDNFKKLLGAEVSKLSEKVPSSDVVFMIDAKNYSSDLAKTLFNQIEDLKLRMNTIKDLYGKEPAYFKELGKITEPDKSLKTLYQKVLLAEWKSDCGKLANFTDVSDEVIKLGNVANFSERLSADRVKKIEALKNNIYKPGKVYTFSYLNSRIFLVSNGVYRAYFSSDLNPLFVVSQKSGSVFFGDPLSQKIPAFVNFFNYNSFEGLWKTKIQEGEKLTRLSATLEASPFEIKKTYVFEKNRNLFKFYCSVINQAQKSKPCDISFEVLPASGDSLFLSCGEGQFYGTFENVSKEFNNIDRAVFPYDGSSLNLKFFGNFPFFLSARAPRLEFVYPGKPLAPGERFLFEIHFSRSRFKLPPNTKPLFEFSDIVLDGQATEDLWKDAYHAIDPVRDGAPGCDIENVYFISKKDHAFLYLDGQLSKTSDVYLVRLGQGPVYLKSRMLVPDNVDYYVKIPRGFGYPAAYKWDKLWFATFEKGFSFSFLENSCEIRLPWPFQKGRWAVYVSENNEIKDVAYFTVP